MEIIELIPEHWPAVKSIYLEGIATGQATFQTEAPTWEEWDKSHLTYCRFVAVSDNQVMGWAALSPVSSRCVYAGVAEVSIYIGSQYRGRRVGLSLLNHLVQESERQNIWTLQAGIFAENIASMHLHQKAGFRLVGYREKIGKLHGTWRNVNFLERRSTVSGQA